MSYQEEVLKARISEIVAELLSNLHINYDVTCRFEHYADESDRYRTFAETKTDWAYLSAEIYWNVQLCASLTDEQLKRTALHELMHVILGPLWQEIDDKTQERLKKQNEFVTESLARILVRFV